MELTIDREDFNEAVNWAARLVPAKPVMPILGGVKIAASGVTATLSAFDLEVSAEVHVAADIVDTGETVVSGRLLAAISRVLPRQPVTLLVSGSTLHVKCGQAVFTLPTLPVGDYPALPLLPADTGSIDANELAAAIGRVLPAVSTDQALPFLNAVQVKVVSADTLALYATDKHRIATTTVAWDGTAPAGTSLLIPARTIGDLVRTNAEKVYLGFDIDGALLGIHADDRRTTTRLLHNTFPDCEKVIPADGETFAHFNVEELTEALKRAVLLDGQEFPRVKFSFTQDTDTLDLSSGDTALGGFRESVGVELHGHVEFSVNPRYVLDALNGLPSDKATILISDAKKPLLFRPYDDSAGSYRHVVMPVAG